MSGSRFPVRADLLAAQDHFLEHVRSPGTWWTGAERSAIAAESRIPLDPFLAAASEEVRKELDLGRFSSSANSPEVS